MLGSSRCQGTGHRTHSSVDETDEHSIHRVDQKSLDDLHEHALSMRLTEKLDGLCLRGSGWLRSVRADSPRYCRPLRAFVYRSPDQDVINYS